MLDRFLRGSKQRICIYLIFLIVYGFFDDDSGIRLRKSAGATSFDKVLLLVEVDIEVVEQAYSATLICTEAVVCHVNDDAEQVKVLATQRAGTFTSDTFHNRNSNDISNAESGLKFVGGGCRADRGAHRL